MNKFIEQPISQNPQIDMKIFLENLEIGKNSAQIFRNLIVQHYPSDYNNQEYSNALDHHSMVALDSFLNSISMLKSCDNFDGGFVENRKLKDHLDNHDAISVDNPSNSEVYANQESPKMSYNVSGTRRECYNKKRKITCESREEMVTNLTDDGFAWRKYGQKIILKSHHPRHYYRCTHKQGQDCQATKQIQQISENPIKYKVIYHGKHTCNNNIFKTFPYVLDSQEDHSSGSLILSFDGSNQVNPFLFPVSPASSDTCNVVIANNMPGMTNGMCSINNVYKQSEQISVGVAEINSCSTATSIHLEQNSSIIMPDFSEFLQDYWWSDI